MLSPRTIKTFLILGWVIHTAIICGIVLVAIHFITKYW